jgi:hypothetical protein
MKGNGNKAIHKKIDKIIKEKKEVINVYIKYIKQSRGEIRKRP